MTGCQIKSLIQEPGSTNEEGFPIRAIPTWQPCGPAQDLRNQQSKYELYSIPKSELRNAAMFHVTTTTVSKTSFLISPLKGLILESYLSSFVWLIENGIPWYILYLLVNELKDTPNASAKASLDRFRLQVSDVSQDIQKSYKEVIYDIEYSIGGVNFMISINEKRVRESETGILGDEHYKTLNSSHPRYFMRDLLSQPRALHKFEKHDCLPILEDVEILERIDNAKGEASIYFVDIEGLENIPPCLLPQDTAFKSHRFAIKRFFDDDLTLGLREWFSVTKALEIASKASIANILAPYSAFTYRGSFYIVYPRAICSLDKYLTCTNPRERPNIKIPKEKLWYQLTKIAATLELLHDNGQYHLDLTLANLLIFGEGNLMICDFGESGVSGLDLPSIQQLAIDIPEISINPEGILEELSQTRAGNPPARTLSDEFSSQSENTKEDCLKSYDIYSFGQICFETATYTTLGWRQSKLRQHLAEECEKFEKPSRLGAFCRRCEHKGTLVNKDVVEKLLNKLSVYPSGTTFGKMIPPSRKQQEKIDYHEISNIIRNLINPDINVRLGQGFDLTNKIFQCLPHHTGSLHTPSQAGGAMPKEFQTRSVPSPQKSPINSNLKHFEMAENLQSPRNPHSKDEIAARSKGFYAYTSTPRWLRFLRSRPPELLAAEEITSGVPDEESWGQSSTNLINGKSKARTSRYTRRLGEIEIFGCLPRIKGKLIAILCDRISSIE
ncbi:hypothetical protein TWF506_010474 [Arthrobotrys conoides]|uniref:Protein kinase domain-containing protein n=1 Tax=Arthrobotrys conoides TaxID=74498 RepID=A0AAN8RPY8_9PEZI